MQLELPNVMLPNVEPYSSSEKESLPLRIKKNRASIILMSVEGLKLHILHILRITSL